MANNAIWGAIVPSIIATAVTKISLPTGGAKAPQPTDAKGPGQLPVKLASSKFLGRQNSKYVDGSPVGVARDLGYSGAINGNILWLFGDCLVVNPDGSYQFDSYDSGALGVMSDPTMVVFSDTWDYGNFGPKNFITTTASEDAAPNTIWAEGGTNVVETGPGVGLVYYQQNNRTYGSTGIQGCGVADVTMTASGNFSATRSEDRLFSKNEMCWGGAGTVYNAADGYVYTYTGGPNYSTYVARVPLANVHNAASYSMYNAGTNTWVTGEKRFNAGTGSIPGFPDAYAIDDTWSMQGIGWGGMSQSAPFWSNYYNVWMWAHGTVWGYSNILVMTAPNPWGPWTDSGINVDTGAACPNADCSGGYRYAHMGHPEYDASGKTLVVSWTWANIIFISQLTFA